MAKLTKAEKAKYDANMNYWAKRNLKAQRAAGKKTQAELEKQLGEYYAASMERVISDFEGVYNELIADIGMGREPTPADLYKLDKYWQMQGQLQNELEKLGNKSTRAMQSKFVKQFQSIYDELALDSAKAFSRIDRGAAAQMINSIWCADGKSWSDRVWSNLDDLRETLNENLMHCVITGKKPTELKKLLQERFGVAYYRADTIVRTETAHIQTQAAQKRYTDYGIQEVEIWADPDERTCEVCGKLHKKRYPVGATVPVPAHPNCRCTIIPVVELPDEEKPQNQKPQEKALQEREYIAKTKELQRIRDEERQLDRDLRIARLYNDGREETLLKRKEELTTRASALLAERKELAEGIDVLRPHTLASVEVGEPMSFEAADGGKPNPHYKEDYQYRINCQTCVVSYEARLRGYDVMATGNTAGSVNQRVSYNTALAWIDTETGAQPKYITPTGRTAKQVNKWLDENIKGDERYTIQFSWKGYRSGHIISVHKINGETTLYDPQINKKYTGEAITTYLQNTKINSIKLLRVDTLEFNPDIIDGLLKASD